MKKRKLLLLSFVSIATMILSMTSCGGKDNPNPDPKPGKENPTDPEEPTNPIDPTDPLTTPETWMSVDVTVLPWLVHSYEVDLGI